MLENPIFNPTPNTGVKGQNPGLTTAKYQGFKLVKGSVRILELTVRALFQMVKDMISEVIRPGSTRKYGG